MSPSSGETNTNLNLHLWAQTYNPWIRKQILYSYTIGFALPLTFLHSFQFSHFFSVYQCSIDAIMVIIFTYMYTHVYC